MCFRTPIAARLTESWLFSSFIQLCLALFPALLGVLMHCLRYIDVVTGMDVSNAGVKSQGLFPALENALADPDCTRLLLFPSAHGMGLEELVRRGDPLVADAGPPQPTNATSSAKVVEPAALCDCGRPRGHRYVRLIAIDATWAQAKVLGRPSLTVDYFHRGLKC